MHTAYLRTVQCSESLRPGVPDGSITLTFRFRQRPKVDDD
jgi:hypothetical protein